MSDADPKKMAVSFEHLGDQIRDLSSGIDRLKAENADLKFVNAAYRKRVDSLIDENKMNFEKADFLRDQVGDLSKYINNLKAENAELGRSLSEILQAYKEISDETGNNYYAGKEIPDMEDEPEVKRARAALAKHRAKTNGETS